MIVFKHRSNYFCYLNNPKCGTHNFSVFYNTHLSKFVEPIWYAFTQPLDNNMSIDYSNFTYYHCNLKGAIHFFESKQISLENVVFITTIRNPFEKLLSAYWYALKYGNVTKLYNNNWSQQEDFNKFVLEDIHIKNFEPSNFRISNDYNVNVNILRLENWYEDFNLLCEKYNFPVDKRNIFNEQILNSSVRREQLVFNKEMTNYVLDKYHKDFEDGKYNLNLNN